MAYDIIHLDMCAECWGKTSCSVGLVLMVFYFVILVSAVARACTFLRSVKLNRSPNRVALSRARHVGLGYTATALFCAGSGGFCYVWNFMAAFDLFFDDESCVTCVQQLDSGLLSQRGLCGYESIYVSWILAWTLLLAVKVSTVMQFWEVLMRSFGGGGTGGGGSHTAIASKPPHNGLKAGLLSHDQLQAQPQGVRTTENIAGASPGSDGAPSCTADATPTAAKLRLPMSDNGIVTLVRSVWLFLGSFTIGLQWWVLAYLDPNETSQQDLDIFFAIRAFTEVATLLFIIILFARLYRRTRSLSVMSTRIRRWRTRSLFVLGYCIVGFFVRAATAIVGSANGPEVMRTLFFPNANFAFFSLLLEWIPTMLVLWLHRTPTPTPTATPSKSRKGRQAEMTAIGSAP